MKTFEIPTIEVIAFTAESIMKASGIGSIDATIPNGSPWG